MSKLDCALDLAAAKAARAHINMLRLAVHYRLDALDIGLPSAIRAPVGMADLDAERHAFAANLTFCHRNQLLPAVRKRTAFI